MINRGAGLATPQPEPSAHAAGRPLSPGRTKVPAFVWKGKTRDGKAVSGERVADNKEAVMALLRRDQIPGLVGQGEGAGDRPAEVRGGVPSKDLAIFTRQFSVMIDAGLPLVQCLEILGGQQENKTFAQGPPADRMDVEGGASLADAMRKHPKAFDDSTRT